MYELNRVRLVGIGPRGARYTDVTLDLSEVGEPITPTALFEVPTRRPSPFSLLMLENGGGKTVLLKLLFSVVLPGRRKVVGSSSAALDKFVLDGDTGHVAMEWMHVTTGKRLVTAKLYQRRARTQAGMNPLVEAWYSFYPSSTVDLATLPVTEDGRRRRLDGYKEAMDDANLRDPSTLFEWKGDEQQKWRDHLRTLEIEPDLFDIQRSMNVDEGDAANAFKFSSSKDFVDWLLKTVTDQQDAVSVAKNFEEWSTNLAERDAMMLERDFLEGAVAGLDPVSEAHTRNREADVRAATATREATRLAAALGAREDSETAATQTLEEELEVSRATVVAREGDRDRATMIVNEVRRQTLELELAETTQARDAVRATLAVAELEVQGWSTVPLVQKRSAAESMAESLAEQVLAADAGAAEPLARRDAAASRLLAKLGAAADAAEVQAESHDAGVTAAKEAADIQDNAREEATKELSLAEERHRLASGVVDAAAGTLREAVAADLVPAGTAAGDLPAMVERAKDAHAELVAELELAGQTQVAAKSAAALAETALTIGTRELATRTATLGRATETVLTVTRVADRLGALEPVTAAAGEDAAAGLSADALDSCADAVLDLLGEEMTAHTEHLDGLRGEHREDQRVLEALGEGLLPARAAVTDALVVLATAGVAAYPGWRYLREGAAADHRAALIAAHPDLADGIVLVDATQLPAAREALDAARLLPSAAVAVGAGASLLLVPNAHLGDEPGQADTFVIDPTPALYDEDAAASRREELLDEMGARATHMQEVNEQLALVRDAHTELSLWRRQSPPGHLASLRDVARTRAAEEHAQRDVVAGLADERDALLDRLSAAADRVAALATSERAASDHARDLGVLASHLAAGTEAAAALPGHTADAQRCKLAGQEATRKRRLALDEAERHTRQASESRSQVARHQAACEDVQSSTGRPAAAVPDETVPALNATYKAAQATYLAAAADQDLRDEAERAATAAAEARTEVALRAVEHVAEAGRLLTTAAGADRAGWSIAAAAARNSRDALTHDVSEFMLEIGKLGEALKAATPSEPGRLTWTALDDQWRPATVAGGRELAEAARRSQQQEQSRLDLATNRVAALDRQWRAAAEAARGFHDALLPLTSLLEDVTATPGYVEPSEPAFSGTTTEAGERAGAARLALREANAEVLAARSALDEAGRELKGFASQTRFETMANLVRRSILESALDALAGRADEWSQLCLNRLESLTTDIEKASRYRQTIIDRLTALVDQALKALRRATKLSRLPDDLGDWGNREFLQIQFSDSDRPTIAMRVGDVVDEFAQQTAARHAGSRGSAPKRDGLALLLDAVHAAVPKGFRVNVLKPDSVLRDERVDIEEMNDVFSGGQELTAAIVLYCTLAALKANDRGQMRSPHSGVLFLDNPIGKASASYLLDLQKSVAAALGVQLVYTTGLYDDRALAAFPLWVRMRNDADLKAGLKHIRVAEQVRRVLPDPFGDAELAHAASAGTATGLPGTLGATRVYRRVTGVGAPSQPAPEPVG